MAEMHGSHLCGWLMSWAACIKALHTWAITLLFPCKNTSQWSIPLCGVEDALLALGAFCMWTLDAWCSLRLSRGKTQPHFQHRWWRDSRAQWRAKLSNVTINHVSHWPHQTCSRRCQKDKKRRISKWERRKGERRKNCSTVNKMYGGVHYEGARRNGKGLKGSKQSQG